MVWAFYKKHLLVKFISDLGVDPEPLGEITSQSRFGNILPQEELESLDCCSLPVAIAIHTRESGRKMN